MLRNACVCKHTELSKHTKGQNYAVNAENISK